jgi:dephospho-CoA kinase
MAKHIIGIAGEMASGKDTVTHYLVEKYGAVEYRFSDPLRSILKIIHKEITRDNLTALSTHLRAAFGQDLLAHIIEREAEENTNEIVVIDGVRRLSDIDLVQGKDNFFLVYVDAGVHVRYERLHKRGQNADDGTISFEEFLEDHSNETERFIPELKKVTKEVIMNEGTLEELHDRVDVIMTQHGISTKI